MAQYQAKFSETNLPAGNRVDVGSLSPQARRYDVLIPAPQATQNATTEWALPLTRAVKLISAYLLYPGVVPAVSGGTCTLKIEHIESDGSTAVTIVTAVTILSGITTQIPVALTLAATNPTSMAAGGSIMVSVVTSNHAPGAAGVNGSLTLTLEPVEDTAISD